MNMKYFVAESDKCPDHIIKEVAEIEKKLGDCITTLMDEHSPNLLLASLNLICAKFLIYQSCKSKDELKESSMLFASVLLRNVEQFGNIKICDGDYEKK